MNRNRATLRPNSPAEAAPEVRAAEPASRDHVQDGVRAMNSTSLKFIRFTSVRDRTGLSRSTIWRLERQGAFPKHRRLSVNAVGWLEEEVNDWVLTRRKAG